MVKKSLNWETTKVLQTPSQIREYIDSCKDWLLEPDQQKLEEIVANTQPLPYPVQPGMSENIGIAQQHIIKSSNTTCFICNQNTNTDYANIINANPFTRANCMIVCKKCDI